MGIILTAVVQLYLHCECDVSSSLNRATKQKFTFTNREEKGYGGDEVDRRVVDLGESIHYSLPSLQLNI